MEPIRHLELLRLEGKRLASLPPEAIDAPVPSLPDWTLERVVRHVGKIHRWVTAVLAAGPGADVGDAAADLAGLPEGPDCLPAYREALDEVVSELERHSPDEPVATFTGPDTARFWMRRQAHEVAIHRIDGADAVHAAGGPAPRPLEVDGAADGIDEWARVFLSTRWPQRYGDVPVDLIGRSVHVHGTDRPSPPEGAEWSIDFGTDGIGVEATHAKGDVALRGAVDQLLLVLWRRRPLDDVEVVGDRRVAERMIDIARF